MSEQDDLERQLDAAFASTRPRRGYEDELWARLQARRSRWQWLRPVGRVVFSPAMVGGVTVVVLGLGVFGLALLAGHRGGGGGASSAMPASRSAPAADARFGALPRPPAAPGASLSAGASAPRAGAAEISPGAYLPPLPISLPVYRYPARTGPAPGTIVEADRIPPGFEAASYPSRSPVEAVRETGGSQLVVSGVRLVYVAVADGDAVYLEPVYLVTGTQATDATKQERQVLVPALTSSSIR